MNQEVFAAQAVAIETAREGNTMIRKEENQA
jgi:hypothetical protein